MEAKIVAIIGIVCMTLSIVFSPPVEARVKRIDTHAHFVPPFYYNVLAGKGLTSGGRSIPRWNVSDHLAFMDSLNIEISILSISTPGVMFSRSEVEEARKLAREVNEYGHMLAVSYPGRFQFFATLCLPDVEGSVEEAIYSLDTLKAAGVVLLGNSDGEYLGSKKFDPLMEVLNEREATVFIHPNVLKLGISGEDVEDTGVPDFVMDFLLDTTRAAANLVLKNVTGRFPKIKFLLSHSGGFLPFAAYRMGGALSFLSKDSAENTMRQLQGFYADTALSSSPSALPSTLAFIPNNQITFGSDYPFAPVFGIRIASSHLDGFPIVDEKKQKINFHNANDLFEKPLTHWRGLWANGKAECSSFTPIRPDFLM